MALRKGRKQNRYKPAPPKTWANTKPRWGKVVDERRRATRAQRKARKHKRGK